jgi:O-acetyl-ADP-ribose deacetylase (regulator of RNase III)
MIAVSNTKVVQGDITKLEVDAIVNAANKTLLGGGGVDGAIHRAAGPELKLYCELLNGAETGEAKITPGFELPARYVIHTVGPDMRTNPEHPDELLASCYRQSMELAVEMGCRSVAFPAISTGIFAFPIEQATRIAVDTVRACLEAYPNVEEVIFCCFSDDDVAVYEKVLSEEVS